MILDHINSYRNKFTNKAKSKNYYVNCNEENNNDINIYPNLRYDNYYNDNTLNYINENNIYPKKNDYFNNSYKNHTFRMQKDRFQKFSLNNSSSYIDYKRKSLQPQFSDFKRSNSKLYLNKVTNNIYGDDLNNNKNEEKKNDNNFALSQRDIYNNSAYKHMNIFNKFILFPKHYIYDKFNRKKRTDITNSELMEKCLPGSNQDYIDYINKYREIDLFNKRLLENKHNIKVSERNNLILKERNRISIY